MYARTTAAIQEIAQRHEGQTVVIVCHGGVLDDFYRCGDTSVRELEALCWWNAEVVKRKWCPTMVL